MYTVGKVTVGHVSVTDILELQASIDGGQPLVTGYFDPLFSLVYSQ